MLSELDPRRSAGLLKMVPAGQALLTTAGPLPDDPAPQRILRVESGRIEEVAA